MDKSIVLGADIGGTHITTALVNLETKTVVPGSRFREYVDAKESAEYILSAWERVIRKSFGGRPLADQKIGIAMPGPFDYGSGVAWMKGQDKFDGFYGKNVRDMLAETLGLRAGNIQFTNDAECFLRGEVFSGAAKDSSKVIGLTLGTGLGSSIYENRSCKDADLWCSPFKDGMAEDYLSTRWFIRRYQQLSGQLVGDVKALVSLKAEPVVQEVFGEFGGNLAEFLLPYLAQIQPEVVVIGGNIAHAYPLFSDSLHKTLASNSSTVAIRIAELGETAPLIGAASCWHHQTSKILAE